MNQERIKKLQNIADRLESLKDSLESLHIEEQEYLLNMPKGLQESERHEASDAACSSMSDALGSLEEAIDSVIEVVEG